MWCGTAKKAKHRPEDRATRRRSATRAYIRDQLQSTWNRSDRYRYPSAAAWSPPCPTAGALRFGWGGARSAVVGRGLIAAARVHSLFAGAGAAVEVGGTGDEHAVKQTAVRNASQTPLHEH